MTQQLPRMALAILGAWLAGACTPSADLGRWYALDAGVPSAHDAAISGEPSEAAGAIAVAEPAGAQSPPPSNDAGPSLPSGACTRARSSAPACMLADGTRLPEDLAGDPHGSVRAFAGGAALPAGRYRIEYLDGCVRYVSNIFPDMSGASGFTVHASAADSVTGSGAFWLLSDTTLVVMAPGTVGVLVGSGQEPLGAFASYGECVTANCELAAREFDFSGGRLSLSKGAIPPSDSVVDALPDQREPTFRLSYLDPCPAQSKM